MSEGAQSSAAPIRGRDVVLVTLVMPPLLLLGLVVIAVLTILPIPLGPPFGAVSLGSVVLGAGVTVAAMLGSVHLIVVRRRGLGWRIVGLGSLPFRWLGLALLAGAALVPVVGVVEAALDPSLEDTMTRLIAPEGFTWAGLVGMVLFLGVLVPFAEEVYFRGIVYGWLRGRWGVAVAVPLSAIVFGGTHLVYPLPIILVVVGLGAVFALAYEKSASLWTPIAMHATYNSLLIALLYASLAP